MTIYRLAIALGVAAISGAAALAQQAPAAPAAAAAARPAVRPEPAPPQRSPLLWTEKWRENASGPGEAPVNMTASVSNPDLELKLYGTEARLGVLGKDNDSNNPPHVFSGESEAGPIAVAWRNKKVMADLSTLARIRVATKMSGLHQLYPVVKLAAGDWYLGVWPTHGSTKDWITEEIPFADVKWIKLDIAKVVTKGNIVDKIDLTKVDEIGFADLMPASGHGPGGWFDLGQVDVYGRAVPR